MTKEMLRDNIIYKMANVLDCNEIEILKAVLNQELEKIEIEESQLPATADNSNEYIIEMFAAIKGAKLSEKNS